jgi:hypothetical protein
MCRSTHSPKSIDGSIERSRSDRAAAGRHLYLKRRPSTALAVQLFIQSKRFDLVVEVGFSRFALLLERREIAPQCSERVFLEFELPERAAFELA